MATAPAPAPAEVDLGLVGKIIQSMEAAKGGRRIASEDLIPLLQQVQEAYGYLPRTVLQWISSETGIPTSQIHGVVTFYAQFYTEPQGRRKIYCCRGTACHVRGGSKVITAVKELLGVEEGEATSDLMFSFETVACLGTCAIAPVMVVDSTYHGKTTATGAEKLLRKIIKQESAS